MVPKLIQLFALLFLFLVAGVFWGTWLALGRSTDAFTINEYIHNGKVIIANLSVTMRIISPVCIVLMIASLATHTEKTSAPFFLGIAALMLIISAILVTVVILVPIDAEIKAITGLPETAKWEVIRIRWHFYHSLRTLLGVASFACFAVFLLWSRLPERKA